MEKRHELLLTKERIAGLEERPHVHQYNAGAIRHTKSLGDLAGLSSIGIHLVRVEPGHATTEHHNHECSDEFIYILAGTATLWIGEDAHEVGAGDFAGFPAKGPPHSMVNTGRVDLVYLMGGGRPEIDICNYPRINRRQYNVGGQREYVDLQHLGFVEPK